MTREERIQHLCKCCPHFNDCPYIVRNMRNDCPDVDNFLGGYDFGVEDAIERAVDWLKDHINIPQNVAVNEDGEPFADSYIAYAKERLETANRICEDFKKAMEQE